jgi:hypothetical protein
MLTNKMDKKIILGVLLLSVLLMPLCTEKNEAPAETTTTILVEQVAETTITETQGVASTMPETPLSELQVEACNNADIGGTCESKLQELNVVPLADCCRYLGKCCIQ